MPRKGRGGERTGTPGAAYGNRTDLNQNHQPIAVKTGQTYGEAQRQERSQKALPLPAAPPGPSATGPSTPGAPGPDLAALLGSLPGLTDPTNRPGEPLTAGLPFGPGPGPVAPQAGSPAAGLVRRMLAEYPEQELFDLLAELDR